MSEPVKVGDKLAFNYGYGRAGGTWRVEEVSRITPSGRIVCETYTLNPDLSVRGRSGGYGGPYRGERITPEVAELVERQKLLSVLSSMKWGEQPIQMLRDVVGVIERESK